MYQSPYIIKHRESSNRKVSTPGKHPIFLPKLTPSSSNSHLSDTKTKFLGFENQIAPKRQLQMKSDTVIRVNMQPHARENEFAKQEPLTRSYRHIKLPEMALATTKSHFARHQRTMTETQEPLGRRKDSVNLLEQIPSDSDSFEKSKSSGDSIVWDNSDMEARGLKTQIEKLKPLEQFILLYKYRYEQHPNYKSYLPESKLQRLIEKFSRMAKRRKGGGQTFVIPDMSHELLSQDYSESYHQPNRRYVAAYPTDYFPI